MKHNNSATRSSIRYDLMPLLMMQLKEKIDLSYLKTFKKAITKIVFAVLGFIAATALCYGLFFVAKFLKLFSLVDYVPVSLLGIAFSAMLLLSVISAMAGLVKLLYFSRDNQMLLTTPVKAPVLYVSKLLVFYLYELKQNFSFMVPMFLAYGLISNAPIYFYPWMFFMFLFVSAVPVLVGALLSIPAMWIFQFIKQYRILQIFIYALALTGVVWGIAKVILLLPLDLNLISEWMSISGKVKGVLTWFETDLSVLLRLTVLIGGRSVAGYAYRVWTATTLMDFGILLGVLALLFVLGYLLARPLFFRMASQPFEYRKRNIKTEPKNKVLPGWLSAVKKEVMLSFRTPGELYTIIVELAGLPLITLLLNRIYQSMNTRQFGDQLTYVFNLLIMLLFMLSANVGIASVYSREGRAAYFNKVPPTKFFGILSAKLYIRLIVTLLTAVACAVIFTMYRPVTAKVGIMMAVILFGFSAAHIFCSAVMDLMNPQTEQYGAMGEGTHNPNESKSTLLAILLPIAVAALSLFLFMENEPKTWLKLFWGAIVLMLCSFALYVQTIRLYYKEK